MYPDGIRSISLVTQPYRKVNKLMVKGLDTVRSSFAIAMNIDEDTTNS